MDQVIRLVERSEEPGGAPEAPSNLLTAKEVGTYLRIPAKKVYELGIPRVVLSDRRVRWLVSDILAYVQRSRVA